MNERSFIFGVEGHIAAEDSPLTRGERTRQAILEAAEQLFLAQGYNGTSMRQIAQQTGIVPGGIYNHFASKEDLFRALLEARSPYPQFITAIESLEGNSGSELLTQAFAQIQGVLQQYYGFVRLVLIDIQESDGSAIIPLVSSVVPALFRFMQRVQAAGGIRTDISLPVLTRTFVSLMIGYMTTSFVGYTADGRPRLPGIPDFDAGQWQGILMDILLHGVAAPEEKP